MASQEKSYDYIIVGGGLTGVVIASRLFASNNSLRIALIEVAQDNQHEARVQEPLQCFNLLHSDLEYNYKTTPQAGFNGRQINTFGGKTLGGGSSVNFGTWTRGNAADYDTMATLAGNDRWAYANMLKFLRRSETYHDASASPELHGFDGPMRTRGGDRQYPLRDQVRSMWEDTGLQFNPDSNGGSPIGFASGVDCFYNGRRQSAPQRYSLEGIEVILGTLVEKVVLNSNDGHTSATGVQLANGTVIAASKEVLLACGAVRTPITLMLSGIGPAKQLEALGVPQLVDSPGVGKNYHDHPSLGIYWKLKVTEKPLAMGHPEFFSKVEYTMGLPWDWLVFLQTPNDEAAAALSKEGLEAPHPQYFASANPRANLEISTLYGPVAGPPTLQLPMTGEYISTVAINVLPFARGSVTPISRDPSADPLIDPNFLGCEADVVTLRHGVRQCIRGAFSKAGNAFIIEEMPPPGFQPLTTETSDEEIDRRIRACADSWWHPAGTASMGQVVDSSCKVKGVARLRVVDTSILPAPFAGHYQAPMYGIAERIAEIIIEESKA